MVQVEILWCCGAAFPPKAMGALLRYMASRTPWNTRKSVSCRLSSRVHKRGHGTLNDLERFCEEEHSQFPVSVFYNLIRCYGEDPVLFKGRLCKVLKAGVPIIVEHVYITFITLSTLSAGFWYTFYFLTNIDVSFLEAFFQSLTCQWCRSSIGLFGFVWRAI